MDKAKEFYSKYDWWNYDYKNVAWERKEIYDWMVIKDDIWNYWEITIEIKENKLFAKNKEWKNIFLNWIPYFGDEDIPYFTKKDWLTVLVIELPWVNRYYLEDGSTYSSSWKLDRVIRWTKNIIRKFTKKDEEKK